MKTKIVLMIIITTLSRLGIYSQPLQNTTWKAYYPEGTFFAYFHFGPDTLSISTDNITYTNVGTGQVSGNNLRVVDLPGGACPVVDTGKYTFLILNDTLKFTLVNDLCPSRVTTMTTFNFIRFLTGIQSITGFTVTKLHPNPSLDKITLETAFNGQLSILNLNGQQLLQKEKTEPTITIDVSNLPNGVYLVKVVGQTGVQVGKFIKQ
jgi:hypothetical protein